MEAPNICKASTEDDKHQLAIAPVSIPKFIPVAMTTTHDWGFTGCYRSDYNNDYPMTWDLVGPWSHSNQILSINLNNPFTPIHGIWLNWQATQWTTAQPTIYDHMGGKYLPQGINLYKNMFKYYKVSKSEWTIDFLNGQGFDGENATVPVTVHSYHQNNEVTIPSFDNLANATGDTAARRAVAALMVNPRVGTICGGTPLGPYVTSGFTGIAGETHAYPYAPELRTSFAFTNNASVASDPTAVTNIPYWSAVGTDPTNVNRMHFFIVPHTAAPFGNKGYLRPQFKIRARFHIEWRDHAGNDTIFTTLDT